MSTHVITFIYPDGRKKLMGMVEASTVNDALQRAWLQWFNPNDVPSHIDVTDYADDNPVAQ